MNSRRIVALLYGVALVVAVVACILRPVSFQKANAILAVGGEPPAIESTVALDAEAVLASIPPPTNPVEMVWHVDPDEKYERTIVEGRGNCSNLIFGLSRFLERSDIDYQIVHLMNPDQFMNGNGHTVLRTRYRLGELDRVGIVDVFAGGLPRSQGRFLDVEQLRSGPIEDFSFTGWGGRPEKATRFYHDFLGRIEVGWIPAHEVSDYFAYLSRVPLPLGNGRLEKYVSDGLAILIGVYPRIHVVDAAPFVEANPYEWRAYQLILWLFRGAIPFALWFGWRELRARRTASPA